MSFYDLGNTLSFIVITFFLSALAGCAVESSDLGSGVFVDSTVQGLMYESGNVIGRTDSDGTFYYEGAQEITFSVEGVIIGKTTPKNIITPFDLFTSTVFVSDVRVTNLSRFLQSLDSDQNPENGIVISESDQNGIKNTFGEGTFLSFTGTGFQSLSSYFVSGLKSSVSSRLHLLASLAKHDSLKVSLINLGDGFTAGIQSAGTPFNNSSTSSINLHKWTQSSGYANLVATDMRGQLGDNLDWESPDLLMDADRSKVRETFFGLYTTPYNLAVPGATTKSLIVEKTGSGNSMLDLLMLPIQNNWTSLYPNGLSQLDAAKVLLTRESEIQKLKIITLWTGINDVLGAISPGGGSLTFASISTFLADTTEGHDLPSLMSNISTIVTDLSAIDDTYIFLATIPDVTKMGAFLYREDIEFLAAFSNASATAMQHYDSPLISGTDIVAISSYAFARYSSASTVAGIATYLNYSSSNLALNNAILNLSDGLSLTKNEVDLIRTRVNDINSFIRGFAEPITYPNLFVVDVNRVFEDLAAGVMQVGADVLERRFGGGFFSLDGIYPSNTGYAKIAEEFITRINSPFNLISSDASFSNYSAYVESEGINKDNGIGISLDLAAFKTKVENIWADDPYRDKDGDGFPPGPGIYFIDSINSIPGSDPSLQLYVDCSDLSVNSTAEAISGTECY